MNKEIMNTAAAPAPIGPYNQAVFAGDFLFISGQVALEPSTGAFLNETVAQEAQQVMKNLEAILSNSGLGFQHVIKTTIFLSDMSLFAEVNQIYAGYFDAVSQGQNVYPARETVAVKGLPKDARVEISMIAAR